MTNITYTRINNNSQKENNQEEKITCWKIKKYVKNIEKGQKATFITFTNRQTQTKGSIHNGYMVILDVWSTCVEPLNHEPPYLRQSFFHFIIIQSIAKYLIQMISIMLPITVENVETHDVIITSYTVFVVCVLYSNCLRMH